MSISLYCGSCGNYQGHLNPSQPRDYTGNADSRRQYNFKCRQCEAENGLYEGRIHARHNWNLAMRGHQHVIEDCKKTIRELKCSDQNIDYSIGRSGYTMLQPAKTHSNMVFRFTDKDALCLLTLSSNILYCNSKDITDNYEISQTFAEWIALMRHVECSKMTREAVISILDTGLTELKREWPNWSSELGNQMIRRRRMAPLGAYLTKSLNRTNAERKSSNGQKKSHIPIPSTPNSGK